MVYSAGWSVPLKRDRPNTFRTVVESEKAIIDAILKNDPKTFHSYVLPDSYVMGGDGVIEAAGLDKLMEGMTADCKLAKWELVESMVYWVNDSTVVHLFRTTAEGTCQGQPIPENWESTVWTNKGGKWLAAFHHESPVTRPAAPKK